MILQNILSFTWNFLSNILNYFRKSYSLKLGSIKKRKQPQYQYNLPNETVNWLNLLLNRWWFFSIFQLENYLQEYINNNLRKFSSENIEKLWIDQLYFGESCPQIQSIKIIEPQLKDNLNYVTNLTLKNIIDYLREARHYGTILEVDTVSCGDFAVDISCTVNGKEYKLQLQHCQLEGKLHFKISQDTSVNFPYINQISLMLKERPVFDYELIGDGVNQSIKYLLEVCINKYLDNWPISFKLPIYENQKPSSCSHTIMNKHSVGVLILTIERLNIPTTDQCVFEKINRIDVNVNNQKYEVFKEDISHTQTVFGLLIESISEDKITIKLRSKNMIGLSTHCLFELDLSKFPLEIENIITTKLTDDQYSADVSLSYFDINQMSKLHKAILSDIECGVMTVEVKSAQSLISRMEDCSIDSYCTLFINEHQIQSTPITKNTAFPKWNTKFEFLVASRKEMVLTFAVYNHSQRDEDLCDEVIGIVNYPLDEMKTNKVVKFENLRDFGAKLATSPLKSKLNFSVRFKPVSSLHNIDNFHNFQHSSNNISFQFKDHLNPQHNTIKQYKETYILLHVARATGLRNMDIVGKSDPFFIVKYNNQVHHTSKVISNNLDPIWNETVQLKLNQSIFSPITIELYDKDLLKRDDFLGTLTLTPAMITDLALDEKLKCFPLNPGSAGDLYISVKFVNEKEITHTNKPILNGIIPSKHKDLHVDISPSSNNVSSPNEYGSIDGQSRKFFSVMVSHVVVNNKKFSHKYKLEIYAKHNFKRAEILSVYSTSINDNQILFAEIPLKFDHQIKSKAKLIINLYEYDHSKVDTFYFARFQDFLDKLSSLEHLTSDSEFYIQLKNASRLYFKK